MAFVHLRSTLPFTRLHLKPGKRPKTLHRLLTRALTYECLHCRGSVEAMFSVPFKVRLNSFQLVLGSLTLRILRVNGFTSGNWVVFIARCGSDDLDCHKIFRCFLKGNALLYCYPEKRVKLAEGSRRLFPTALFELLSASTFAGIVCFLFCFLWTATAWHSYHILWVSFWYILTYRNAKVILILMSIWRLTT